MASTENSYDSQEDGVDKTSFSIIEGATYYQRKKESVVFGDFFLKLIGEITDGHWVGSLVREYLES
ncbi:hypothetical protein OS493_012309 [Desmophyllum pertusum]|uniref:Uncharacterized protein n=1 Tax=Desmophyllum pertusum TaxID=174260 RepID=A0A9X0D488_9CNID|nr:hypothetical protein OS493_012309 [Desmophyllum pertusum]